MGQVGPAATQIVIEEGFAMSQWVKCTFTHTPENLSGVLGYINLGLAHRVYSSNGHTTVVLGPDCHQRISVRETPEELMAQLTKP